MNLLKIKALSEEKRITLQDLAKDIGMSYQNLNRCMRENKIQAQDLEKISEALNVPIIYFFEKGDYILMNKQTTNGATINGNIKGGRHILNIGCDAKDKEIEYLKKEIEGRDRELKLKDEIIEMLKRQIR